MLCQIWRAVLLLSMAPHIVGEQFVPSELLSSRHRGDFDGGVCCSSDAATPPFRIGFDIEAPLGSDGMQPLGNEQVNIVEMLLSAASEVGPSSHNAARTGSYLPHLTQ